MSRCPMPLNEYGWKVLMGLYEKSIATIMVRPTKRLEEIVVRELYENDLFQDELLA